jgi:hypothetical protein
MTVYVVVTDGNAVTIDVFVGDRPTEGCQLYVLAPLAVSLTLPPLQMVAEDGVTFTCGFGIRSQERCQYHTPFSQYREYNRLC